MYKYNVLDLFSGIGGFSLGLERTGGFKTVAFCEIDPFCRRVLKKHWPKVPCYEDVKTLTAKHLGRAGIVPNVICGGFPCQDISCAGRGEGITGARSGLWSEYSRLIGELRPDYAIVENVSALLARGLDRVLGDLAALRYDAEWHCIPASAVGAPHRRDRIWIIAYPASQPIDERSEFDLQRRRAPNSEQVGVGNREKPWNITNTSGSKTRIKKPKNSSREVSNGWTNNTPPIGRCFGLYGADYWSSEPDICRVADGVSINVDRLCCLGNAVVPQIPEMIGNAILAMNQ